MDYVVGFAFDPTWARVVLVRKVKPAWQSGRLNGVGGKVEPGETALEAMVREFREETGVATAPEAWSHRVHLTFPGGTVAFFSACLADIDGVRTTTQETIEIVPSVPVHPDALPNLHWLIPLCLDAVSGPGPIAVADNDDGSALRAVLEA